MAILDRFNIKVVACAGLCGAVIALSPDAVAGPLITGGYACMQGLAGDTAPPVAAGGPLAADACVPASGPLADMAGVPLALPGPVVAPVPAGAPVPVAAPVPVGAPVDGLVPVGAPLSDLAGSYGGKGEQTRPAPVGGPLPGEPVLPGPLAAG